MTTPLFSTYSQGENRVTSSILAVFERISFVLVEAILRALSQETETNLLVFRNQPPGIGSVPDAVIRASFAYYLETKIVPNAIRKSQIEAHLKALDAQPNIERQRLIVLTPDAYIPKALEEIKDERLAWANFDTLVDIISQLLTPGQDWITSDRPNPTEREREMLRELVRFLISERLVGVAEQAVVVAARIALPEYLQYSVYMCQPNRPFQPCTHLAFYAEGKIHHAIPRVLDQVESIVLDEEVIQQRADLQPVTKSRLLDLLQRLRRDHHEPLRREEAKVIFLSAPDAEETLLLPHDIRNDLVSESGRGIPFTQGQRYLSIAKLKKHPKTTSELLK